MPGTALDALTAAPQHHRLALENGTVRVLETRVEPGQTVPLHVHEWSAALYVLNWSAFVRRDQHGNVLVDTRQSNLAFRPGDAIWSGPLDQHTLENVGDQPLHIIAFELKA